MNSYSKKLPREHLKLVAKKLSKKLVNSEYKHNRVLDPTKVNPKAAEKIKAYVREGFENAVKADRERRHRKARQTAKEPVDATLVVDITSLTQKAKDGSDVDDEDATISDDDKQLESKAETSTPLTPMDMVPPSEGLKRKRQSPNNFDGFNAANSSSTPSKRLRSVTPPFDTPPALQGSDALALDESHNEGGLEQTYPNAGGVELDHQLQAPPPPPPPPPPTAELDTAEGHLEEDREESGLRETFVAQHEVHIE